MKTNAFILSIFSIEPFSPRPEEALNQQEILTLAKAPRNIYRTLARKKFVFPFLLRIGRYIFLSLFHRHATSSIVGLTMKKKSHIFFSSVQVVYRGKSISKTCNIPRAKGNIIPMASNRECVN